MISQSGPADEIRPDTDCTLTIGHPAIWSAIVPINGGTRRKWPFHEAYCHSAVNQPHAMTSASALGHRIARQELQPGAKTSGLPQSSAMKRVNNKARSSLDSSVSTILRSLLPALAHISFWGVDCRETPV